MGAAGDIQAGRAYVELFTKDSSLYKGLDKAQARFKNFGTAVTAIGSKITAISAAALAPFALAGKMFIDTGDQLDELSDKTSISVESLSALKHVAALTDTSLEDMAKGLQKGQKLVVAASKGNKEAAKTLSEIGLAAKDLVELSPDQMFAKLVDGLSKIDNPAKRSTASLAIFGKGAGNLAGLIKKGGPEIERLTKQAEELGLIMSKEDAAAAAGFNDALYSLRQQIGFLVGVGFTPWLRDVTEWLTKSASRAAKFMKANQDITRTIVKLIAVVGAVGVGLIATGAIFSSIAAIIGGLMGTLTAIGATFGVIASAVGFLISPLGIVIAAVSGLTAWFVTCTDKGKAMITTLTGYWEDFSAEVKSAFSAITDALMAGDIQAAWKVVTTMLQLEWTKAIGYLQISWAKFKGVFMSVWNDATTVFSHAWNDAAFNGAIAINQMIKNTQIVWTETVALMQRGWLGFLETIRRRSVESIAEGIARMLELDGSVPVGTGDMVRKMARQRQMEDDRKFKAENPEAEMQRARDRVKIKEDANAREKAIRDQHRQRRSDINTNQDTRADHFKEMTDNVVKAQEEELNLALAAFNAAKSNAVAAGQAAQKELLSPNTTPALSTDLTERQKRQAAMLDNESLSEGKRARIARNLQRQGVDVNAYRAAQNGTDGVSEAMKNVTSRGTFNPMALQALALGGGGDINQKQLDEAKKTREEQKKQTQELKQINSNIKKKGYMTFA